MGHLGAVFGVWDFGEKLPERHPVKDGARVDPGMRCFAVDRRFFSKICRQSIERLIAPHAWLVLQALAHDFAGEAVEEPSLIVRQPQEEYSWAGTSLHGLPHRPPSRNTVIIMGKRPGHVRTSVRR